MSESFNPPAVKAVIQQRKTLKVLCDAGHPIVLEAEAARANQAIVMDALRTAGWAPFHFNRKIDDLAEPWRAHVLWHDQCQRLAKSLPEWFDYQTPDSKIVQMLNGCGALVLVTWLPEQPDGGQRLPRHDVLDSEHLAATAAMTQNLLLMLTAHKMGTYWSSGGVLATPPLFEKIGVGSHERLLAAVFIEFPETQGEDRTRKAGANRQRRSQDWIQLLRI